MIKNLAFSGTSSKFFIILGVFKSLFDYDYINLNDIENIICSSGSILVIYYLLLGYNLNDIRKILIKIDMNVLLFNNKYNENIIENIFDYNCIINNKKFREIFELFTHNKIKKSTITFKELYDLSGICLIINAFCLETGKLEYFTYKSHPDMNVIDAILMTVAMPIVFQPVSYNGKTYSDPGIVKHIDIDYYFKDINIVEDKYLYDKINNETLGIIVDTSNVEYVYNTGAKSDDEKIIRLVNYLSKIFCAIIDTRDDYKKYNYIKIPSDIKIYNIEVSEDIKNKLIILGYKECYNYIKNKKY